MVQKVQAFQMQGVERPLRYKPVSGARLAVAVAMGLAFTYGCATVHAEDAAPAPGTGTTSAASTQTGVESTQTGKAAKKKKQDEAKQLAGVTVSGIRASLETAQSLKQNADQIVDSVTAVDINALPDRSVTETLQRISGVTVDHFLAAGDADHPASEGSSVEVRGLTYVASELNGRDTFSANNGRSIGFEDVPAELMAGVDVYKNPSAEIIEGGIGGTVNLRTRMPFDSPGRQMGFSTGVNEGDLARKSKPSTSFLYSNRWKTENLGEFGALLDVSYSELASRTDGIQTQPYVLRTDLSSNPPVYVPGGVDWRELDFQRRRVGLYGALQWRPNKDLEIYSQFFSSRYNMSWDEHAVFFNDSTNAISPAPGTQFAYNDQGVFENGSLTSNSWRGKLTGDGVRFNTDDRIANQSTKTTDWSSGFKYNLNDHMMLSGDVQFVKSTANYLDFTVFNATYLPNLFVSTNTGLPSVSINPSNYILNKNNYFLAAAMDHREVDHGDERAARLDLEYDFENSNWLQYVRFGIRATNRGTAMDSDGYNWGVISDNWASVNTPTGLANLNYVPDSMEQLFTMSNFFRGSTNLPTTLWFPSTALAGNYSGAISQLKAIEASSGWTPQTFTPADSNSQGEQTKAAYAVLYFGNDSVLGIPFDGNIGVRLVRTDVTADGNGRLPLPGSNANLPPSEAQYFTGAYFPITNRDHYKNVLPSLNLRFKFTDDLQLRIAGSKAVSRPDFSQLNPYTALGATLNPAGTAVVGWTGSAGNPYLKPMIATQFDTALEWYFAPTGMLYTTAFFKDIKNYIATEVVPETFAGQVFQVSRPYNSGTGMVRGAEAGYSQFFDFLPGYLKGLGLQANYTFIRSTTAGLSSSLDPLTNVAVSNVRLPMTGLSPHAFNLTGMYEYGPWSARLAWSWRSRYLLTTEDAGSGLPVWAEHFGQLDGSVFYHINKNMQVGLQMNNLTNRETRTLMGPTSYADINKGIDYRLYTRGIFVNDRRFEVVFRANL